MAKGGASTQELLSALGTAFSGYGSALLGNPMYLQNALLMDQAQEQKRERDEAERRQQVGNASAMNFLRSAQLEGAPATKQFTMQGPAGDAYPAFAGGNRTVGQTRAAVPMQSADPIRMLSAFSNGDSPLQSMAAKQAMDMLGFNKQKPTYQTFKPGDTLGLVGSDGTVTPVYTAPGELKTQTAASTLGKLKQDFDAGHITRQQYEEAVRKDNYIPPQAPENQYKRVDYWRERLDPEFKAVNEASISLQKIENAIRSGASLSTAIQLLQKIIDEKGVVRGEDVRMFTDAQPLVESWKQELKQSATGTLTPESANRVLGTARALVSARYGAFNNNFQAAAPLMQSENVDPNRVIPQQVLDRFSTRRFQTPPSGAGMAQASEAMPKPQTQADYDALPSGATYIDPDDNRQYRKP